MANISGDTPLAHSDDIPLDLGNVERVAAGTYRDVYVWPGEPRLVVKVLRKSASRRPGRPIRNFLKARSARQLYRFMFREFEAYLEARLSQINSPGPMPLSRLFGLVQTSRGLGMIAECVRGSDGALAHSLANIARAGGPDADTLSALNAFISRMEELDLVANDTNPTNLLLDESSPVPRFVLVDGFGDPSPFQIKRLSSALRRRARERRWVQMADFLGLDWNRTERRLERR